MLFNSSRIDHEQQAEDGACLLSTKFPFSFSIEKYLDLETGEILYFAGEVPPGRELIPVDLPPTETDKAIDDILAGRSITCTNEAGETCQVVEAVVNKITGAVIPLTDQIKRQFRLARLTRRVVAWSKAVEPLFRSPQTTTKMITLTYRPGCEWRKNHIRDFNKNMRRRLGKGLLAYAWVSEMQERGAVHYHCMVIVRKGVFIPYPDKPTGQKNSILWPHGMSRVETAKSVWYLTKYAGKEKQKKNYPPNIRIFGVWIDQSLVTETELNTFKLSAKPRWLANRLADKVDQKWFKQPKPSPGGGWAWFDGEKEIKLFSEWGYFRLIDNEWVDMSSSAYNWDETDNEADSLVDLAISLGGELWG